MAYKMGRKMGMASMKKKTGGNPNGEKEEKRIITGKGKKRVALQEKPRFISEVKYKTEKPKARPGYKWEMATGKGGRKGYREVRM